MTDARLMELLDSASDMGFLAGVVGAILITLFNLGMVALMSAFGAPDFLTMLVSWAAGFALGMWFWRLTRLWTKKEVNRIKEEHADKSASK